MTQTTVRAWGSSQGIIIPSKIMKQAGLKNSDVLNITVTEDSIVLTKPFRHRTLEERIEQYNGDIEVYTYDWGEPVGREQF